MEGVTTLAAGLEGLDELRALVGRGGVVVLSGAGLSTESGIPDYRGPTGAQRRAGPMTYQDFVGSSAARHRYWARSYLGWRQIAGAAPNAGHHAVARLQQREVLDGIITQNVDGLHQAAGADDVIELHGGLDLVVCLACGIRETRTSLDGRLRAANPDFGASVDRVNPDGDADLADADLAGFHLVGCSHCQADLLKPDVVFFGENVPKPRVEACYALVESARSLLVLGSSLTVMSGLRFVRRAAKLGVPVAIVNQGWTRGDDLADLKLDAPLGAVLTSLVTWIVAGTDEDRVGVLAARSEADTATPAEVRSALDELLVSSPGVGVAVALGLLAREPRIKPSRSLLIDPGDAARGRWARRVAAAAALLESAAVNGVFHEVRDELAEDAAFAEDVLSGAAVHPSLPAERRAQLAATRPVAGAG